MLLWPLWAIADLPARGLWLIRIGPVVIGWFPLRDGHCSGLQIRLPR